MLLADAVQGQIRNAYNGDTVPTSPRAISPRNYRATDSRDDSCAAHAHGYRYSRYSATLALLHSPIFTPKRSCARHSLYNLHSFTIHLPPPKLEDDRLCTLYFVQIRALRYLLLMRGYRRSLLHVELCWVGVCTTNEFGVCGATGGRAESRECRGRGWGG